MKNLLLITIFLLSYSLVSKAELQQDVINRDAISFDNIPSGVNGSVQFKSGGGFGSDTNFFFDSNNISLGVGTDDPTLGGILPGMKFLAEQEVQASTIGGITHTDEPGVGSAFFVARSRGTKASPSAVQNGDRLANFLGYGFGSTFYGLAGEINIEVFGLPSGNTVPGRMNFRLRDSTEYRTPLRLTGSYAQFDCQVKPTCDAVTRGAYCHNYGGAGVKDTVEVCAKDAGDAYSWRTLY